MRAPAAYVFIALAIAVSPVAAVSGPLQEGRAAYERGDSAAALGLLGPLAEGGGA